MDLIKRLVREFQQTEWSGSSWIDAFKNALPQDLEIVLKTSLVELKAKNFDRRRPAEELETLLKRGNAETLLLIDELPLLVANIVAKDPAGNRAERFLLWLKRLREQYAPRWFFAGSIGLDSLARRLRLTGLFTIYRRSSWGRSAPEKSRAYLMGRGQYYDWALTADTIDAILSAVEWPIPFHLNLVFEAMRVLVSEGRGAPSPALVEMALGSLMKTGRTHFDHWDERMEKMLDARCQSFCEIILGMACREAVGARMETIDLRLADEIRDDRERGELLRHSLDFLISDGYLVRSDATVHFRSALVRRYWREVQA